MHCVDNEHHESGVELLFSSLFTATMYAGIAYAAMALIVGSSDPMRCAAGAFTGFLWSGLGSYSDCDGGELWNMVHFGLFVAAVGFTLKLIHG